MRPLIQNVPPSIEDPVIERMAKTFEGIELDGTVFNLESLKGRVLIVNFWASWCDPCVREFPSLIKLVQRFKGEVVLVAVSADKDRSDVADFIKAFEAKDPAIHVVLDPEFVIAKKWGTYKLPESYVVGRDFKVVRKIVGLDNWLQPEIVSFFSGLVGETKSEVAQ